MKLTWKTGGLLLGLLFFVAVWVSKPVGISTEFSVTSGVLWHAVNPGLVDGDTSTNEYYAAKGGSIAKAIDDPLGSYGIWFATATIVGGFLSYLLRRLSGPPEKDPYTGEIVPVATGRDRDVPQVWRDRFGDSTGLRLGVSFIGGIFVLYGARLADGCTSGHMMSGMMQTSISGYIFALGAFGAAVPLAFTLYRKVA